MSTSTDRENGIALGYLGDECEALVHLEASKFHWHASGRSEDRRRKISSGHVVSSNLQPCAVDQVNVGLNPKMAT